MANKLGIYNSALLICGERFLQSLTEERNPRRLLDHAWDEGAVKACLEEGQWRFAMRTVMLDYDPSVEPGFGYARAFLKPDDWVLTSAVCEDEFFRVPLTQYTEEAGYWYSALDTIYVQYVSDDVDYGNDLGKWPESFREYVAGYLAAKIVTTLTNSESERERVAKERDRLKGIAKNRTAMGQPTAFPAQGAWSKSRSRFPNNRDGGSNSGPLLG